MFPLSVVKAQEQNNTPQFSASYNTTYDIDNQGVTQVTQGITLINKTDRFFASSFSLTIGATQISDVQAFDAAGPLPVETENLGNKTKITVTFVNQNVVGEGKEFNWTLKYKSSDFAQKQGKIWQVSVPKIGVTDSLDKFSLVLSVPLSFGDPYAITPEPIRQTENKGKVQYYFDKSQLLESGILATFGTEQLFKFNLGFNLENHGFLPTVEKIPLPPNTKYQQVIINNIDPKPDNVTIDMDGNYIAWFKLDRKETKNVKVNGLAKISIDNKDRIEQINSYQQDLYTSDQRYWDKSNPYIRQQLVEIFKDENPQTNVEKAKLINKYVAQILQFSNDRKKAQDFDRLGSVAALKNPDKALCYEYTDLFLALTRAANVPSRMLIGYAYTTNNELRPLCFDNTNSLHTWVEYYDPSVGWVMADPTWESTTGGVDYFSQFDLNHLTLLIRGSSSNEPMPPDMVEVNFSDEPFLPVQKIGAYIESDEVITAGFPAAVKVKVQNTGNTQYNSTKLELYGGSLSPANNEMVTPIIPPFGFIEYEFRLKSNNLWSDFKDTLVLKIGDQVVTKQINVKPFFDSRYFSWVIIGLIGLMVVSYIAILILHFRISISHKLKRHKKEV